MYKTLDQKRGKAVKIYYLANNMKVLRQVFEKEFDTVMNGAHLSFENKLQYDGTLKGDDKARRFSFKTTGFSADSFEGTFLLDPACHAALNATHDSLLIIHYIPDDVCRIVNHADCEVVSDDEAIRGESKVRIKIRPENIIAERHHILPAHYDIEQFA